MGRLSDRLVDLDRLPVLSVLHVDAGLPLSTVGLISGRSLDMNLLNGDEGRFLNGEIGLLKGETDLDRDRVEDEAIEGSVVLSTS